MLHRLASDLRLDLSGADRRSPLCTSETAGRMMISMRRAAPAALVLLLAVGCLAQADYEEADETHVAVLTDADYEEKLAATQFALVSRKQS